MKKINRINLILFLILSCCIALIVGISYNFLAITKNQCKMPVNMDYDYETETHISYLNLDEINYIEYTDKYLFNKPFSDKIIYYSLGDVIVFISGISLILIALYLSLNLYNTEYKHLKTTEN